MLVDSGEDDRKQTYFVLAMRYLIWNVVTFIICLVCNSSQGKFSKYKIGEVGDIYRSALSPAGFAFSIWGLIYLGLTAFLCYHLATVVALFRQKGWNHDIEKNSHNAQANRTLSVARMLVDEIGIWFGVGNLLNASWIPVFVQATDVSVGIAAVILIGLVLSLIRIQLNVHHWWRKVEVRAQVLQDEHYPKQRNLSAPSVVNSLPAPVPGQKNETSDEGSKTSQNDVSNVCTHQNSHTLMVIPIWELFLIDFSFSIYLGWTTAAATLNTTMWFENIPLKGNEILPLVVVLIALVVASMIFGVFYLWRMKNFAAGFVFTWAASAIWVGTLKAGECDQAPGFDEDKCNIVGITALALGVLIGALSTMQLIRFVLKVVAQGKKSSGTS